MLATAIDLKPGDEFKWRPRQIDFRTVNKIVPVPESGPKQFKGQLIIVLSDCSTLTIHPNAEVIIKQEVKCTAS